MANLTPKTLYIGSDSAANVYTLSSNVGSYAIVKNINICNTGGSTLLCNVHLIPASGSAGANNKVLSNFSVLSGETISYDSAVVINAGASIYVSSSVSTATYTISGVEYVA
jgi:hypothetical protein